MVRFTRFIQFFFARTGAGVDPLELAALQVDVGLLLLLGGVREICSFGSVRDIFTQRRAIDSRVYPSLANVSALTETVGMRIAFFLGENCVIAARVWKSGFGISIARLKRTVEDFGSGADAAPSFGASP
jgi:hypothetical protein